ncbi:hypothetical protein [Ancylobacter vacuolatus]|uniref:Uncharacterized protein n=1 Tax=Ancylobacter vacuolatus TaxID=223389 RepID=A0ABU0DKZ4_9HYPH|nr:hypothetical protein [Ancylobacter vacuolatus]MDQ0349001.1 hypothetical protein [Ancylobacter vacuolatus]
MTLSEGKTSTDGGGRRTCVFVAATPLQILFSLSIAHDLGPDVDKHMIMIGSFTNGEVICDRFTALSISPGWKSARYFPSFRLASRYAAALEGDELFIGGDAGLKHCLYLLFFKLLSRNTRINVYEEGVGTYRKDLYSSRKRAVIALTGAGTHLGNSVLTSNVYVLRPDAYLSALPGMERKVRQIVHSPVDVIRRHLASLCALFSYPPLTGADRKSACCILYLSSWSQDEAFIKTLTDSSDDVYLKPHPHFKGDLGHGSFHVLTGAPPAELILVNLLDIYDRVTVFHHGSSTELYFSHERVEFVRI